MKFKCNTIGCEKTFEIEYSEEKIEKEGMPICPFCEDIHNKSYRVN